MRDRMGSDSVGRSDGVDRVRHKQDETPGVNQGFVLASKWLTPYLPPFGGTFAHGSHKKSRPEGRLFIWLPLADLNCGPSD